MLISTDKYKGNVYVYKTRNVKTHIEVYMITMEHLYANEDLNKEI